MQRYFKFIHSKNEVRKHSSSGGAFTLISDIVLNMGGIIYGCIIDKNQKVKHIRATRDIERDKMRGSKYIQSDIKVIFPLLKKDLNEGKIVLFSGTPCQCFELQQYLDVLHVKTDKLLLLEVVCHGVGSKRFFVDYINYLEKVYKGKTVSVNFRAKYHLGQKQDIAVEFDNGKAYHASSTKYDWFYSIYLKNLILRPACYECPFAKEKRYSDLSIADHWGFRDNDAYSLIVCNTEKGWDILNKIRDEKIEEIEKFEVKQPHMMHPCERPDSRDAFWDKYYKEGYLAVQKLYGNNTIKGRLLDLGVKVIYDLHLAGLIKKICRR